MANVLVAPRIGALNTHFMTQILGVKDQWIVSSTSTDVIDTDNAQLLDTDGELLSEDGKSTYRAATTSDVA